MSTFGCSWQTCIRSGQRSSEGMRGREEDERQDDRSWWCGQIRACSLTSFRKKKKNAKPCDHRGYELAQLQRWSLKSTVEYKEANYCPSFWLKKKWSKPATNMFKAIRTFKWHSNEAGMSRVLGAQHVGGGSDRLWHICCHSTLDWLVPDVKNQSEILVLKLQLWLLRVWGAMHSGLL